MENRTKRFLFIWSVVFLLALFNTKFVHAQASATIEQDRLGILMSDVLMFPAGPPVLGRAGFVMDAEENLHIVDRGGEKPFVRINPSTAETFSYGSWGEGPGDVRREGFQVLSMVEDRLYVYDAFGFSLQQFNLDGELVEYEVLDFISMPGIFLVMDEKTAIYSPIASVRALESEYWFTLFERKDNRWERLRKGLFSFSEHPDLKPVQTNPGMGMGAVMQDDDGSLFFSTIYSSLLAGVNSDGTVSFKHYEPANAQLPIQEIRRSGQNVSVDPEDPMFHSLDIALCSDFVYVLYAGEQYLEEDLQTMFGGGIGTLSDEDIRPGEGKLVYVFEKSNGALIYTLELDFYASAILATDDHLYLVSWDDPIGIHVLKNTAK